MNTETNTNNRPVRKAAIAIGFVALLVLIAWLSITIVKNVPGSFASLASLAESVRSFDALQVENASDDEASNGDIRDMLLVTSDINVVETNNNVHLSWTDTSARGSFIFAHECTDGVSMTIIDDEGDRDIECGVNYNIGDVNNVTIRVSSANQRFVDVPYTISFLSSNDTEPAVSNTSVLTVVNESVPLTFADASDVGSNLSLITEDDETEIVIEDATSEQPINDTEEVVDTDTVDSTPAVTPTPQTPGEEFTQEFTYTIPVSDPDGYTDLATRFINTGQIVDGSFVVGDLAEGETGAVQFEVKNLGTKTSEKWTYEISLPIGQTIESDGQEPLKPNERAVITVGFPVTDTDEDFEVVIDTEGDNISINDRFIY